MRRLTVSRIEGLAPEAGRYELTDPAVAGLQLRIEPTGAKSWILRYYWRGRRVRLSLGSYPETSKGALTKQPATPANFSRMVSTPGAPSARRRSAGSL